MDRFAEISVKFATKPEITLRAHVWSEGTRYGFRHVAVAEDGTRVSVPYYNRTWECNFGDTALSRLAEKVAEKDPETARAKRREAARRRREWKKENERRAALAKLAAMP